MVLPLQVAQMDLSLLVVRLVQKVLSLLSVLFVQSDHLHQGILVGQPLLLVPVDQPDQQVQLDH